MRLLISFFVFIFLFTFNQALGEEPDGNLTITLEYTNGDRLDTYQSGIIIYQDNKENLFQKIESIENNPFTISLPLDHKYILEPVINGIHTKTSFVILDREVKNVKTNLPLSGGVKFTVFYNDNYTPIEGALVSIKTQDGKEWKQSITDEDGKTARFWIQSTKYSDDFYIVETNLSS